MKKRILIHSLIFRRDYGFTYILSKLLENNGCDCIIVNNRNALSKHFVLWNPHAIILGTTGWIRKFKKKFPRAKLFFCAYEGGMWGEYSDEARIAEDDELFLAVSKVYLWSQLIKDYVIKRIEQKGKESPLYKRLGLIDQKFVVIGNPKIDIQKFYRPSKKQDQPKIKIGFIGDFWNINAKSGLHTLAKILNKNEFSEIIFQANLAKTYLDLIEKLGTDKYAYEIRPYPHESIDSYLQNVVMVKKGILSVNTYLEYCSWVNEQDLIIGATSSTIIPIAIGRKPYINLDALCNRSSQAEFFFTEVPPTIKRHQPKTFEELLSMIERFEEYIIESPALEKALNGFCNYKEERSVTLMITKDILAEMSSEKISSKTFIPYRQVQFLDDRLLRYKRKKYQNDFAKCYSYFLNSEILPEAAKELDPIVENILEQSLKGDIRN